MSNKEEALFFGKSDINFDRCGQCYRWVDTTTMADKMNKGLCTNLDSKFNGQTRIPLAIPCDKFAMTRREAELRADLREQS